MKPSRIEQQVYADLAYTPALQAIARAQHAKGRKEYGHAIDHWAAERPEQLTYAAEELADLYTYLRKLDAPQSVINALGVAALWLDKEMEGQ